MMRRMEGVDRREEPLRGAVAGKRVDVAGEPVDPSLLQEHGS